MAHRKPRYSAVTIVALALLMLAKLALEARADGFITRKGSMLILNGKTFRFAGTNCYWLGLDENVDGIAYPTKFRIDDALATAANMGATVVRAHTLGISVGNPMSVEPSLNTFNATALQVIDYAIQSAQRHGIHLIVPLVDNYHYYHGGKHTFTDWRGIPDENAFYTNTQVIADFENYVATLLNHVNVYTHIAYKDDPTILAWETGNELSPPTQWTATIAQYLKGLDHNHLVLDGTYGINPAALDLSDVDIVSDHFYPLNASRLTTDSQTALSSGKVFVAGEVGWADALPDLPGFLNTALQTTGVSGDLYWSLFPHLDTYGFVQHGDGFTLHYPGDNTDMAVAAQALRSHAFAMQGIQSAPTDNTPLTPRITVVDELGMIGWRGAANSATYQVERSLRGSAGPWSTLTEGIVTDNDTPWQDTTGTHGRTVWYRVRGENLQKKPGPYSPIVKANLDVIFTDTLANLSLISWQTPNWLIDTTNPQYLGGDPHRATRTVDDLEQLLYRRGRLRTFLLQVYSKQNANTLANILKLYTSLNHGQSYVAVPWIVTRTWAGGQFGGWTGYELRPESALPKGADGLLITVGPGSGYNWDPQIARVTLGSAPLPLGLRPK